MRALSRHDFRVALDFIAMLGEASTLDDFAARMALGVGDVIPCDYGSFNELNGPRQRVRWITNLATDQQDIAAFERHFESNPMVRHFGPRPLGAAVRVSDLLSLHQWRNLGVYHDLYHRHRLERLLGVEVAKEPMIALAVFRDGSDFTDRDCAMMTLLRPHLGNIYRHTEALTDLGDRLELLQRGFDIGGLAAIVLRDGGRVGSMTVLARSWLETYFGMAGKNGRLPAPVETWIARFVEPSSVREMLPTLPAPLTIDRTEARLVLRLVRHGGRRLILMEEQRKVLRAEGLASLGLAPREAEILAWLVLGKTDGEIAVILDISPRTVSHTLERVYRKLGVTTRVAAARRAFEAQI